MIPKAITIMSQAYNMLFNEIFTKAIFIVIVLLLGMIIGRTAGRMLNIVLHEIELNKILKKAAKIRLDAERIISFIAEYTIYVGAIIWALNVLNLTKMVAYAIAAVILVVVALSFMLATRDFFPNALAGIIIKRRKILGIGDTIRINNTEGKVIRMHVNRTRIETKDKEVIYIPNSTILKEKPKITKAK